MNRMPSRDVPTADGATGSGVAVALRLALGTASLADRHANWTHVFEVASRELLVPADQRRRHQVRVGLGQAGGSVP